MAGWSQCPEWTPNLLSSTCFQSAWPDRAKGLATGPLSSQDRRAACAEFTIYTPAAGATCKPENRLRLSVPSAQSRISEAIRRLQVGRSEDQAVSNRTEAEDERRNNGHAVEVAFHDS